MNSYRRLKIPAVLSLLLILMVAVEALCYPLHMATAAHVHHTVPVVHDCGNGCGSSTADHGPSGEHNSPHADCSSCGHSHTSVPAEHLFLKHAICISQIHFNEPFRFIPEVYFDKFIPPQNLA